MRRVTGTICTTNGRARSLLAKFWRWPQRGGGRVEERKECRVRRKKTEFEIKDCHIPVSGAFQSLSRHTYFSKTWKTHQSPFSARTTSTTASSGDQPAELRQALHQCLPPLRGISLPHAAPVCIHRDWQHAYHATLLPPQESFVITSFNILASKHASKHRCLYPTIPFPLLRWDRRRSKLLAKLVSCSPDIVCLQEVDEFKDLEEDLALRGYAGLYKARTGDMPDGCAIFWRKERFQLLQKRSFEFSMLGMRNNVAQLCVLQLIVPGLTNSKNCSSLPRTEGQAQSYRLVVGNIHVLFNPKRGDIKLGQCRAFLEQVHHMSKIWHGAPVVIGGDFNSTPSSAVYKYLATSELDLSNWDRRYLSGLTPEVPPTLITSRKQAPSRERVKEISVGISTAKVASQQILMGSYSLRASMEHAGAVDQIDLHVSLDSRLEDIKLLSSTSEQNLESREQASENSTSVDANLKGAAEILDASAKGTAECTEFGPSNHVQISSNSGRSSTEGPNEYICNDYGWGAEELRIATGNPDCTVMQHGLELYSAYPDIQGLDGTRDARGEPLVTTCHLNFLGTVDYIWRNGGLKTMRVLETLPVKAFKLDKGLPIKAWGSDHLPLVCELAFT